MFRLIPSTLARRGVNVARIMGSSSFSTTAAARPFQILGVQQIALGSVEREPLANLWTGIFGFQPGPMHRLEKENVEECCVKLGPNGKPEFEVEIDLMCPINPDVSPKVHVPPLNHIGLWVDNLEDAVDWMLKEGVRFTPGGIRKGAAGHNVTFIHPKGNKDAPIGGNGVLIELVQAPDSVIAAFSSK